MTRREFDRLTKRNLGDLFGQRTEYRRERRTVDGVDYIATRASHMTRRNRNERGVDVLHTLGTGSMWRNLAQQKRATGAPMLEASSPRAWSGWRP